MASDVSPGSRPLTVPLPVRGPADRVGMAVLAGFFALLVGTAIVYRLLPPAVASTLLTVLGLLVFPALVLVLWRLRNKRWLEVTADGFVLTVGGTKRAYLDAAVEGLSHTYTIDSGNTTYHRYTLEVASGDEAERVEINYTVYPGWPDPVEGFWSRLIAGLGRRVRAGVEAGGRLDGVGWHLDAAGLHSATGVCPLDRVDTICYFGKFLSAWKDGEAEPFLRLSTGARNVPPLAAVLWDHVARRAEPRPLKDEPLGRVLLEKRSQDGRIGALLAFLGGVLTGVFALAATLAPDAPLRIVFVALSLPCAWLLAWSCRLIWRGLTLRIRFHEHGVSQPGRGGDRRLLYSEIETVVCRNNRSLELRPAAGAGREPILFRCLANRYDEELAGMRDYLCATVAQRWWERLARGPVEWTKKLSFYPDQLVYRGTGLFGRVEVVTLPYALIRYQLVGWRFRLWGAGDRAVGTEDLAAENFFVGLMFLSQIYHGAGRPAVENPLAPRGSLRGDDRIQAGGQIRG